jgi:hypothetical protein
MFDLEQQQGRDEEPRQHEEGGDRQIATTQPREAGVEAEHAREREAPEPVECGDMGESGSVLW